MAQDRKPRSKEFLGGITTFSGADIEVLAFRDLKSLNYFKIQNLENERNQIQEDRKEATTEISRLTTQARNLQVQATRNEQEANEFLEDVRFAEEVGLPSLESYNAAQDLFGKAQNQRDLAQNNLGQVSELRKVVSAGDSRVSDIEAELESTRSITFAPLGNLHTISYSSFREKFAVRTLGKVQAKSYTQGPRTIAGTMVFNIMQEHELMKLAQDNENTESGHPNALLLDQLKPFNLMLIFSNEFGSYSTMLLFDVTIQSEGQEMSIEQIVTMNTMNFYAEDIIPLTPIGNRFETYDEMLAAVIKDAGGVPVTKSNRSSYRVQSRLEKIFNQSGASELGQEIDEMLSESRGLF
jgi:hypothetical protein